MAWVLVKVLADPAAPVRVPARIRVVPVLAALVVIQVPADLPAVALDPVVVPMVVLPPAGRRVVREVE